MSTLKRSEKENHRFNHTDFIQDNIDYLAKHLSEESEKVLMCIDNITWSLKKIKSRKNHFKLSVHKLMIFSKEFDNDFFIEKIYPFIEDYNLLEIIIEYNFENKELLEFRKYKEALLNYCLKNRLYTKGIYFLENMAMIETKDLYYRLLFELGQGDFRYLGKSIHSYDFQTINLLLGHVVRNKIDVWKIDLDWIFNLEKIKEIIEGISNYKVFYTLLELTDKYYQKNDEMIRVDIWEAIRGVFKGMKFVFLELEELELSKKKKQEERSEITKIFRKIRILKNMKREDEIQAELSKLDKISTFPVEYFKFKEVCASRESEIREDYCLRTNEVDTVMSLDWKEALSLFNDDEVGDIINSLLLGEEYLLALNIIDLYYDRELERTSFFFLKTDVLLKLGRKEECICFIESEERKISFTNEQDKVLKGLKYKCLS